MKQVTAYASSLYLDVLINELMDLGIQEMKTLNNYSKPAGISRIKLLCDEEQARRVRILLSSIAASDTAGNFSFSVQEVDRASFLKSPL